MRRPAIALPLVVVAAVAATAAAASGGHEHPSGVTVEPLAVAQTAAKLRAEGNGIQLRTNGPKTIMTARITVEPGGSLGWHSHPGPVIVAVDQGTFSLTQVENGSCRTRRFGRGEAFVEDGGRVHLGRNQSDENVRILATFLARAGTTEFSRPEPIPTPCR